MRVQPKKRHFTKAERKFVRLMQERRIPFKAKYKIRNREIDFIIGKYAIEIDSHKQDPGKNVMLIEEGFHPLHFHNWEVVPALGDIIKNLWQEHH